MFAFDVTTVIRMKKALIATMFGETNIGNRLQNYAMQRLLQRRRYIVRTIDYEGVTRWRHIMKSEMMAIAYPLRRGRATARYTMKYRRINRFTLRHVRSVCVRSFIDPRLEKLADWADVVIAGADVIWRNWVGIPEEIDFFMLRFAPEFKRVCIAPSIGLKEVPESNLRQYLDGWNGFVRLSCREADGCDYIRRVTGREVTLLSDPTMMLEASEWSRLAFIHFPVPKRYLLVFGVAAMNRWEVAVRRFAEERLLEIVDIHDITKGYAHLVGPREFLWLIQHTEYLLTDSFHGTIFAILFRKDFTVVFREDDLADGLESRLYTLLETFGMSNRVTRDGQPNADAVDYSNTDIIIREKREAFYAYLDTIL
ncbi:hypothetical protein AGMMS49992_16290 [Clostridia bacterium]|nr:hypothetical protein AGMMS49992_16290 [Clostridia bacterium]